MAAAAAAAAKKPSLAKVCAPAKEETDYCEYPGRSVHMSKSHKQKQGADRAAGTQQRKKGTKRRREERGSNSRALPGGVKMDNGEGMREYDDGREKADLALELLAAAALKQEEREFQEDVMKKTEKARAAAAVAEAAAEEASASSAIPLLAPTATSKNCNTSDIRNTNCITHAECEENSLRKHQPVDFQTADDSMPPGLEEL